MERDVELGLSKLRYEIRNRKEREKDEAYEIGEAERKKPKLDNRLEKKKDEKKKVKDNELNEAEERMIFDPMNGIFNYAKRRVTDLRENVKVTMPKPGNSKEEAELEMIRKIIMDEFRIYKNALENIDAKRDKDKKETTEKDRKRNQEWKNLSQKEKRGLRKLVKRIRNNEIVILKTDKSGKLTAMLKEDYLRMGLSKIENDRKVSRGDIKANEDIINAHTRMILKVVNAGEEHGHLKRITDSKLTHSETSAPMYFMFKDHKKEGGWRPVVAGCNSNTLGMSNLVSDMVESICGAIIDPY